MCVHFMNYQTQIQFITCSLLMRITLWALYVAFLLSVFYIFTFLSHKFVVPIVQNISYIRRHIVNAECHINTITEHTGGAPSPALCLYFSIIYAMRYTDVIMRGHYIISNSTSMLPRIPNCLYVSTIPNDFISLWARCVSTTYRHIYCTTILWQLWEIWVLCEVTAVHAFTEFPYVFWADKRQ